MEIGILSRDITAIIISGIPETVIEIFPPSKNMIDIMIKITKEKILIPTPRIRPPGAFLRMAITVLITIVIIVPIASHHNAA